MRHTCPNKFGIECITVLDWPTVANNFKNIMIFLHICEENISINGVYELWYLIKQFIRTW